jgi:hypothetical protein
VVNAEIYPINNVNQLFFANCPPALKNFLENQSAASLFLNYFKEQLEIVQYISECRQLIVKLLWRTI